MAAASFWALFVAAATAYATMAHEHVFRLEHLRYDLALVLLGTAFSLGLRLALGRLTGFRFTVQILLGLALVAAIALPFELAFKGAMSLLAGYNKFSTTELDKLIVVSLFWIVPFGLWAAGTLALLHDAEARRRELRLTEAQLQANEAQVRALRYQINPHFLYNTLNSIAALILDRRNEEAEAMVLNLSAFFRSSLASDPFTDVPLADEIEHQLMYLDIEQVRFADALDVRVDVPCELAKAGVPSLILQPLVENAVKHGLRGPGKPMRLTISARADGERLSIEVADDGRGARAAAHGTGTGLKNVERRLASRFAGCSSVETDCCERGFTVRLHMPLQLAG